MNRFAIVALFVVFFASCRTQIKKEVDIIPRPQKIEIGNSVFKINSNLTINYEDDGSLGKTADYFSRLVENKLGLRINDAGKEENNSSIKLLYADDKSLFGEEGYKLSIKESGIKITAATGKGIFYGLQSLFQLMLTNRDENDIIELPEAEIADDAMFKYRGMHLDVGRHIFPVRFIKKYIDLLALYKFNTFHWHLTDDQGWRIEIKKYPRLTEIGAWRDQTLIGHGGKKPYKYDGEKYGGFYNQDEIRDIVKYAEERKITIIPEIEMPGHSMAALAAYPELACHPADFKVAERWGVFDDIYCAKDETFEFLENVLLEVMELFPSKYIHIGGDEAPKTKWKTSAVCQATIKREGLKDEQELQSYFIQRIGKFLNAHGRSIIGWDEILEGGLAANATLMSWRGTEGGIAAAMQGHDVIMTPGSYCYFDHYQANPETEPLAIGGYTSLEKVYYYNPIPDTLSRKEAKHILGAQANVWTEYMGTSEYVEYMILPRMAALAEVDWTYPANKDWGSFKNRVKEHFRIYDELGYDYCDHPFETINKPN